MNDNRKPQMTILDQRISDDTLQIIKAAVPYLPSGSQRTLSLTAKVLELQKTLALFVQQQADLAMMSAEKADISTTDLLKELQQYTGGALHDSIEQLLHALTAAQVFMAAQSMEEE